MPVSDLPAGGVAEAGATAAQPPAAAKPIAEVLEPTSLALGESAPVAIGMFIAVPFLATPWLLHLVLTKVGGCGAVAQCGAGQDGGIWVLDHLIGVQHVPAALHTTPTVADAIVGLAVTVLVVLLLALLRVPLLGGFAPVLKVLQPMRPRSGMGFDFTLRQKGRPHRISISLRGTFAGYPGDGFLTLTLQLPSGAVASCDHQVRPVSGLGKRHEVPEYIFDPIYFQFTPLQAGKAHLWVGYGTGPECRMKITVQQRS
jgi:hypothetical protein